MGRRTKWLEALVGRSDADREAVIGIFAAAVCSRKATGDALPPARRSDALSAVSYRAHPPAAEEESHAEKLADKLSALGAGLPEVVPIHVAHETNSWHYLKTDLDEEERCAGELHERLSAAEEFP